MGLNYNLLPLIRVPSQKQMTVSRVCCSTQRVHCIALHGWLADPLIVPSTLLQFCDRHDAAWWFWLANHVCSFLSSCHIQGMLLVVVATLEMVHESVRLP